MTTTERRARRVPGTSDPHIPTRPRSGQSAAPAPANGDGPPPTRPAAGGGRPREAVARDGDAHASGSLLEAAIVAYGARLASAGPPRLAADPEANALLAADPFALLVGVLADQGVAPDRAWGLPLALRDRLGHLDPARIAADPEAVHAAFREAPMLHRFTKVIAGWVIDAAIRVRDQHGGDAAAIWAGAPAVADVLARLRAFPGIGETKAATAVGILAHGLGVPMVGPDAGEAAVDPDVARVLARTGLGPDDPTGSTPPRTGMPGPLRRPLWEVGRRWCAPAAPDCPSCALAVVCPRQGLAVDRGAEG